MNVCALRPPLTSPKIRTATGLLISENVFTNGYVSAAESRRREMAADAERYQRGREQVEDEYIAEITPELMSAVAPDLESRMQRFEEQLAGARRRLDVDQHHRIQSDYTDYVAGTFMSAAKTAALLQPQSAPPPAPAPAPAPQPRSDPLAVVAGLAGVPVGVPVPTAAERWAARVFPPNAPAPPGGPLGGPPGGPPGGRPPGRGPPGGGPRGPPGPPPPGGGPPALAAQVPVASVSRQLALLPRGDPYDAWRRRITSSDTLRDLVGSALLTMVDLAGHEHVPGFRATLLDGTAVVGRGGPGGGLKYLAEMENQAQGMPEPEVSQRQYNAQRFRTVDVQDLFEDQRRLPVPRLAPGRSVYRRPRMAEEGVPENAELV